MSKKPKISSREILVIDDEEMIRNIVRRIMDINGHNTYEANSGDVAVEMVKNIEKPYDYVILDLSMPGELSGKDTFHKIKELTDRTKIIISTGYINSEEKKYFLSNGAYAILEKPFQMDEITSLIE